MLLLFKTTLLFILNFFLRFIYLKLDPGLIFGIIGKLLDNRITELKIKPKILIIKQLKFIFKFINRNVLNSG